MEVHSYFICSVRVLDLISKQIYLVILLINLTMRVQQRERNQLTASWC